MQILLIIMIFLKILTYIIFFDVILSWLTIFWLRMRPQFIADIIDPLYKYIKKIIPTTIWPVDFTPIILIMLIIFLEWLLYTFSPELTLEATNLLK